MRTTYIVTYDVSEPRRLRRVFKTCKRHGDHLQLSVFECDLNSREKAELEKELRDLIDHTTDQVLFIALGPSEGRGERVISSIGLPYFKFDAPCYIA
jgi:CRISPR-associated protein Cas2